MLTGYVREGDTVICHWMDRLARNLDDLRKVVLGFTDRGVHVRFEKENLNLYRGRLAHIAPAPERNGSVRPI